jgi:hypothetical protein
VFTTAGEAACHQLQESDFRLGPPPIVWTCVFPTLETQNPLGPAGAALTQACAIDAPAAKLTLQTLSENQFDIAMCGPLPT